MPLQKNKQIVDDVDDIILWLEKRNRDIGNGNTIVAEYEMPVLARVICGGEHTIAKLNPADKKLYGKYFDKNKKLIAGLTLSAGAVGAGSASVAVASIASGVGTAGVISTLSTAGMTSGLAAMSGLSFASMGAAAFLPALWPIGISLILIGAGSTFFKKKSSRENTVRSNRLGKIFEYSRAGAQKCNEKIKANNKKIQFLISQKLRNAKDKLSSEAEKIKISIDDALNVDQNLRIMQYQEIVLKQYNSQNEIRKAFADLVTAYNILLAENEELAKQVAAYEATMKMSGCANNYLE